MNQDIFFIVDSLGWALLHSLWQGIVVWILFGITHRSLANSTPHIRHINALLWLIILLVLPITTCVILFSNAATSVVASNALLTAAVNTLPRGWLDSTTVTSSFPVLVSLWLATLVCLSVRTIFGWKKVRKLSSQGCFPMPQWQACVQRLVVTMGVRVQPRLRESIHIHVPMVVGWIKPVVLVPSSAILGLSPRELELIIAHELAHIRRFDYVSNYLLVLAENVLFYHPAVHVITHVIRQERELCCDDLVIKNCGDRLYYVRALAKLETLRGAADNNLSGLQLAATDGPLLRRIRRIASGAQQGSTSVLAAALIAMASVAVGGMSAWLLIKEAHLLSSLDPAPINGAYVAVVRLPLDPHAHLYEVFSSSVEDVYHGAQPQQAALEKSLDFIEEALIAKRRNDENFQKIRAEMKRQIASGHTSISLTIEHAAPDLAWHNSEPVNVEKGLKSGQFDARALLPDSEILATMVKQTHATQMGRIETPLADAQTTLQEIASKAKHEKKTMTPAAGNPYNAAAEIEGGALIRQVQPRYPMHARLRGKEGAVQVELHVDRAGNVTHAKVVSLDSNPLFERSVLRAVTQWSFEPMLRDGEPIERTVKQLFDFRFAS